MAYPESRAALDTSLHLGQEQLAKQAPEPLDTWSQARVQPPLQERQEAHLGGCEKLVGRGLTGPRVLHGAQPFLHLKTN